MALMVGCWCRDNHNAQYIEDHRWDVGTVEAFAERAHAAYSIAEGLLTASIASGAAIAPAINDCRAGNEHAAQSRRSAHLARPRRRL